MSKFTLQQIESFVLLAETNSFTKSAQELGISKTAVSKSIKQLEHIFGLPLFIRSTRYVQLTHEGKILYEQSKQVQVELEATQSLVNNFHLRPHGHLKLSVNLNYKKDLLLKVIKAYSDKFPDVKISIIKNMQAVDFNSKVADVSIGVNWPKSSEVMSTKIGATRYVLCATKQYLNKYGIPNNISDLKDHRYIPLSGREKHIVDLKKDKDIILAPHMVVDDVSLLVELALQSQGIIQVHEYLVESYLKSGDLVEVLNKELSSHIDVNIYHHKQKYNQPKIREFVKLYLEMNNILG